jgi:prepilin-type N-terminal cleavage/methylation domain-containing protein
MKKIKGFTLLEISISIIILGISLILLYEIQNKTKKMYFESKNLGIAIGLAKLKSIDCEFDIKKKNFSNINYFKNGNFQKLGINKFMWKCKSYPFRISTLKLISIFQTNYKIKYLKNKNILIFVKNLSFLLKNSIREMIVIIKWNNQNNYERIKITKNIIKHKLIRKIIKRFYISTNHSWNMNE